MDHWVFMSCTVATPDSLTQTAHSPFLENIHYRVNAYFIIRLAGKNRLNGVAIIIRTISLNSAACSRTTSVKHHLYWLLTLFDYTVWSEYCGYTCTKIYATEVDQTFLEYLVSLQVCLLDSLLFFSEIMEGGNLCWNLTDKTTDYKRANLVKAFH